MAKKSVIHVKMHRIVKYIGGDYLLNFLTFQAFFENCIINLDNGAKPQKRPICQNFQGHLVVGLETTEICISGSWHVSLC